MPNQIDPAVLSNLATHQQELGPGTAPSCDPNPDAYPVSTENRGVPRTDLADISAFRPALCGDVQLPAMEHHTQLQSSTAIGVDAQQGTPQPEAPLASAARGSAARAGEAKSTRSRSPGLLAGMRHDLDPPIASHPVYVDEQALSRLTTLSRTTLQTMRRKGGGPPFAKLGHRIVYRLVDVELWIQERTRSGTGDSEP